LSHFSFVDAKANFVWLLWLFTSFFFGSFLREATIYDCRRPATSTIDKRRACAWCAQSVFASATSPPFASVASVALAQPTARTDAKKKRPSQRRPKTEASKTRKVGGQSAFDAKANLHIFTSLHLHEKMKIAKKQMD
jgi:hypothetical protein